MKLLVRNKTQASCGAGALAFPPFLCIVMPQASLGRAAATNKITLVTGFLLCRNDRRECVRKRRPLAGPGR
jgi:hypothetical protein